MVPNLLILDMLVNKSRVQKDTFKSEGKMEVRESTCIHALVNLCRDKHQTNAGRGHPSPKGMVAKLEPRAVPPQVHSFLVSELCPPRLQPNPRQAGKKSATFPLTSVKLLSLRTVTLRSEGAALLAKLRVCFGSDNVIVFALGNKYLFTTGAKVREKRLKQAFGF